MHQDMVRDTEYSIDVRGIFVDVLTKIQKIQAHMQSTAQKKLVESTESPDPPSEEFKPPWSRYKIVKTLSKPKKVTPADMISDAELQELTMESVSQAFKCKWSSLSIPRKKNRIKEYAKRMVRSEGVSSEHLDPLETMLIWKILTEKSLKPKLIEFDEHSGTIVKIIGLRFDHDKKMFTT